MNAPTQCPFGQRRLFAILGLWLGMVVLILLYENCGQPVGTDEGAGTLSSQAANLDFAYDVTFDQMTYLSCAHLQTGTFDRSSYFSLRAGAYRTGGISVNQGFVSAMGRRPKGNQVELLMESPANSATSMQMAIRGRNNYQTVLVASGTSRIDEDYQNFFAPLGTFSISQKLVELAGSSRSRYNRNGVLGGERFEASVHFSTSPTLAESVRQYLRNDGFLGLTFTHIDTSGSARAAETMARSPSHVFETSSADIGRSVYGRGYQLRFAQPSGVSASSSYPTTVLREVSEMNLLDAANRTQLGNWTCPAGLQFKVVRDQDLSISGTNCQKKADPAVLSETLALARHTLRVEDWYIDMDNRCIIAKKSGPDCYGDFNQVQYSPSQACSTNGEPACLAFASVCYRTN